MSQPVHRGEAIRFGPWRRRAVSFATGGLVVSGILWRGIVSSSLLLLLTVTGYLLYYAGGEDTRPVISALHWVVGLSVPALLVWHVVAGRRRSVVPSGNREIARDPI